MYNKKYMNEKIHTISTVQSIIETAKLNVIYNYNSYNTLENIGFIDFKREKMDSNDSIYSDQELLTMEFNTKLFRETGKNLKITLFSSLRDEITNYRTLSKFQLENLRNLSEEEKIDIIKMYNEMFSLLREVI